MKASLSELHLTVGQRDLVKDGCGRFPGTIAQLKDDAALIAYDDGDVTDEELDLGKVKKARKLHLKTTHERTQPADQQEEESELRVPQKTGAKRARWSRETQTDYGEASDHGSLWSTRCFWATHGERDGERV